MTKTSTARRIHVASGPLVVSHSNPRYFTDTSTNAAVYLTGSHIWNNFHDGMGPEADCAETPEPFDFAAYLAFLNERGHNFIRLWRWEHFKSQAAGGGFHLCMTPQPWPRTGPGTATDGKPKFDLSTFDRAYFDRLRERVDASGKAGIYVAVMLFEGWALHLSPPPDNNIEGHPFHAANNVNDVGITSIVDYQVLPLDSWVQEIQRAYMRKVVDAVHDLPNVLYEVANESSGDDAESIHLPDGSTIPTPVGDSTQWQYWVIDFIKQYEQQMGYDKHPVGMTMQYPVPPFEMFDPARYAMGDTLRYARIVNFAEMEPRGDLSSTGFVLANPGTEYLVLQPDDSPGAFTVRLATGDYTVEWYSVSSRETTKAGKVKVEKDGNVEFTAPFAETGPAVLLLRQAKGV